MDSLDNYIVPLLKPNGTFESVPVTEAIDNTVGAKVNDPAFQAAIKGDKGDKGDAALGTEPQQQALADWTTGENPFSTALNAATAKGAILADVSPAKTATQNRTALQAAVTLAQSEGRDVELPTTRVSERIRIDGEILVNGAGNIRIYCPRMANIYQTVKPEPIFHIGAPNVTVQGVHGYGDGLDMTGMVSPDNYGRYAVVWLDRYADGARVSNVKGTGMHKVILIDNDFQKGEIEKKGSPVSELPNMRDVKLHQITSNRCWAGVLASGFDGLEIVGLRGTYLKAFNSGGVTTTGAPPHLIYTTDRTFYENPRWSRNLTTRDCLAWDSGLEDVGNPAAAYAIKGVMGWTYDGMQANGCSGIFDLIAVQDISPGAAVSVNDVYPNGGARGAVAAKNCISPRIRATVHAQDGDNFGRMLYVEGGTTDGVFEVDMTVNPTTARTAAGNAVARVSGARNEVRLNVHNQGAELRAAIEVQGSEAHGNRIIHPKTTGLFRYPIEVRQGVGAYVEYEAGQVPAGQTPVNVEAVAVATRINELGPAAGYVDTFTRADADRLGVTEDGRSYLLANGSLWGIENQMAYPIYRAATGGYALPRGGAPNGTITFKIGATGGTVDGYMLRTTYYTGTGEPPEWLKLDYISGTSDARPRVRSRRAGTNTLLAQAPEGTALAAGDVITVELAGPSVVVKQNGATIITTTDDHHQALPASGMAAAAGAGTNWKIDHIEFVAA